eukprot:gene22480-30742_t
MSSQSASDYFKASLSELEELGRMIETNSSAHNMKNIGMIASEMNKKNKKQKDFNAKRIRAISKANEEIRKLVEQKPIVNESSHKMVSSCQQATITKLINRKIHLSSKEMILEDLILAPYRSTQRDENLKSLLDRVAAARPASATPRKTRLPSDRKSVEEHSKAVEARRMRILASQSSRHQEVAALRTERVASQTLTLAAPTPSQAADSGPSNDSQLRRAWSAIVSSLSAFAMMSETLQYVRESRRRSSLQLSAAILIHRWLIRVTARKATKSDQQQSKEFGRLRMRLLLARPVYQNRLASCSVITTFLLEMSGKSNCFAETVKKFIRKVVTAQRAVRRHLACSAGRLELIGRHLDKVSPALTVHINIVLSHRGADLKNLTRYDMFLLKGLGGANLRTSARDLHALLRENMGTVRLLQKSYNSSRDIYSFDDATKRLPFLQLLYRKRRLHRQQVEMMKSKKHLLQIPPITVDQARTFLLADDARSADPFTAHIEHHLAVVAADEAAEQEEDRGGHARSPPLLLLLQMLSGEDCAQTLFGVTESFRRSNVKRVRKGSGTAPLQLQLQLQLPLPANNPSSDVDGPAAHSEAKAFDADGLSEADAVPAAYLSSSPSLHATAAEVSVSPPSSPKHGSFPVTAEPETVGVAAVPPEHKAVAVAVAVAVAQNQLSETPRSLGGRDRVEVTNGAIRKARLQSLAHTLGDAEKVLRKLEAMSVHRPSSPRPSTAGTLRYGRISKSPGKSLLSSEVQGAGCN